MVWSECIYFFHITGVNFTIWGSSACAAPPRLQHHAGLTQLNLSGIYVQFSRTC